jgi:PAS domain S-box-containing protein
MSFVTDLPHEMQLLGLVEQLPVGVLLADGSQQLILANRRLESLLGYASGELLGQRVDEIWGPHVFDPDNTAALGSDRALSRRIDLPDKNGRLIALECRIERIKTPARTLTLACLREIPDSGRSSALERQMTAIIESTDDAVLTKSLDGIIRSFNPGAERLLGYRPEEVIGGPVTRLIPPELQTQETMILDRLRKGERVAHFETVRCRKNGEKIDVSLTISPLRGPNGVVVGASKIMRDISGRKRTEAALYRSNLELQRINADLDEFVYTASHDLRSPLTNIAAVAQWILDDDVSLSPKTRDRLKLIQGRIERMKKLLSDIRDYARGGQYEPGEPLSAMALVNDVIDGLNVPPGFSIRGDETLRDLQIQRIPLAQIFHNLIDNAIKHHDRRVGCIVVSVDRNGPMLRFSVTDDGPGIPPEYREEIFGMFKMLKPKDQVEGSGMGLALIKKIVVRMGGACGVESASGRGSAFWFDWPESPRTEGGDHA